MNYIVSWSGGKDCCLAYYMAIQKGYKVSHLINFISEDDRMIKSHEIQDKLIQLQAELIGLPLLQKSIKWNNYKEEFKTTVNKFISKDIKGVIFGDIYVPEFKVQKHKIWVDRVCNELGIKAIEPLWGIESEKILLKFIDLDFEAIIVCIENNLFDEGWLGQKVDKDFFKYLKRNNIEICGEKGEYHTFVTKCPMFKKKILIEKSRPIMKDNYWFLNILDYSLKSLPKSNDLNHIVH
ncbi:MAG: diphthine--ammonia ligase [Promethearchaeota archaeon]